MHALRFAGGTFLPMDLRLLSICTSNLWLCKVLLVPQRIHHVVCNGCPCCAQSMRRFGSRAAAAASQRAPCHPRCACRSRSCARSPRTSSLSCWTACSIAMRRPPLLQVCILLHASAQWLFGCSVGVCRSHAVQHLERALGRRCCRPTASKLTGIVGGRFTATSPDYWRGGTSLIAY